MSESLWGMALEFATLASMMLTFVLLSRSLGPTGYGSYVAMYAIVTPVVTYAGGGVTLTLLQKVVRDGEPLPATTRACLAMSAGLGIVLVLVGLLVAAAIVRDLSTTARVAILATEFLVVPAVQVAAAAVQSATTYVGTAKILIGVALTKATIVVALHLADRLTVENLAVCMVAAMTVFAAVVLAGVSRRFAFPAVPGRVGWRHLRTNLAYSVGISGASLNNDGDKLVLSANNYVRDNGLYGAATRVVGLGMVPVHSLVAVSHRRFLLHEPGRKGQHVRRAVRFALPAAGYAVVWCLALVLFSSLLPIVLGDDFEDSVQMVRWLAPVVIIRALSIFPLNALMGLGHVALRSTVIVVNALIAIGIYIALIPAHGWKGAVVGTLISEVIELVAIWSLLIVLQRREDREIDAAAPITAG